MIKPATNYTGRCFQVLGTLNMYGGKISGFGNDDFDRGAAVYDVSGGQFKMHGGIIERNTTKGDSSGAVDVAGVFMMTGGKIINNTGTGICVDTNGTMKISQSPIVTGNTVSNVYLNGNNDIQKKITVSGSLANTASLGISMKEPGVFTSGLSGKGNAGNFFSDSNGNVPDDVCCVYYRKETDGR